MPRSINKVASKFRRKKILNATKGYSGSRSKLFTIAKNAIEKALLYAYIGRKKKKRYFRTLWIQRINAGAREHYLSYSKFLWKLAQKHIFLNRKILAHLVLQHQKSFNKIINILK